MQDKILDFIDRRWKNSDANWMNGNCYWFAFILCEKFPYLEIYYLPIQGHFVAGIATENRYYDWTGIVVPDDCPMRLSDILVEDALWYDRLIKDCRD